MGSSNRAVKQAKRQEQERQAAIDLGTGRVNAIYDAPARAGQRDDFVTALRAQYGDQLDRQKMVADRRLRFALARNGLTGGSAAVDANRTLGEDYMAGLVDAENRAQGAGADLMAQDEESRLALLQLVQSGMDAATAGSRAQSALRTNLERTRSGALTDSLGDVFGNTATIYKRQEEGAERRRGEKAAFDSIYGRRTAFA